MYACLQLPCRLNVDICKGAAAELLATYWNAYTGSCTQVAAPDIMMCCKQLDAMQAVVIQQEQDLQKLADSLMAAEAGHAADHALMQVKQDDLQDQIETSQVCHLRTAGRSEA